MDGNRISSIYREIILAVGLRRTYFLLAVVAALASIICLSSVTTGKLELFFLDCFSRLEMHQTRPDPRILIVGVDAESLAKITRRWPWPREIFSELLKKIHSGQPAFVILDILLQHPEQSDGGIGDRLLSQTIREMGNLGMVSIFEEVETRIGVVLNRFRSAPEFRKTANVEGFAWAVIDGDGYVRSFILNDDRMDEESLVAKVSRILGPGKPDPRGENDTVTGGPPPRKSFISFPPLDDSYPEVSACEVLADAISPETFRGKIVIIGGTAPVLHDYHQTLLGVTSGPEILAATLDTLLRKREKTELSGLKWRAALMVAGFLSALLLTNYCRSYYFLKSLIFEGVFFLGAGLLFWFGRVAIPVTPFFLAFSGVILSVIVMESLSNFITIQSSKVEGEASREIQKGFFPPTRVTFGEYSIFSFNLPCEDVGGDYCDVEKLDEKNLFFLMGDVSGHGFPAAMVMTMAKTSLQIMRQMGAFTILGFVDHFNQLLRDFLKRKRMMTAILGTLDFSNHIISLSHAGHLFPLVISSGGEIKEISARTVPLGHQRQTSSNLSIVTLNPGDSLLLYTDGITEAINWRGEGYGYPRWYEFLRRFVPKHGKDGDINGILEDLKTHVGGKPFDDDITVMLIKRFTETETLDSKEHSGTC